LVLLQGWRPVQKSAQECKLSDALQRYWIAGSDSAMTQCFAAICWLPARAKSGAKRCGLRKRVFPRRDVSKERSFR